MYNGQKLIFWEENNIKKWEIIKKQQKNEFIIKLFQNPNVNKNKIFMASYNKFIHKIATCKQISSKEIIPVYEKHQTYHPPFDKNKNTKYGWISPDGRYFHCEYQGHVEMAEKICFGLIETNNPEHYLTEHGWCKIYKSFLEEKYQIYIGGKHVITDQQMKTLISMNLDNIDTLSDMLCKE